MICCRQGNLRAPPGDCRIRSFRPEGIRDPLNRVCNKMNLDQKFINQALRSKQIFKNYGIRYKRGNSRQEIAVRKKPFNFNLLSFNNTEINIARTIITGTWIIK